MRYFINIRGSVIDSEYRRNVEVILFNLLQNDFKVCIGDCTTQIILDKIRIVDLLETDEFSDTERDATGFGSTGK